MYTTEERVKIVELYQESKSVVATQRKYRLFFNVRKAPTINTIKHLVWKFRSKGTILNQHKAGSGRPRTSCTVENIQAVKISVEQEPKKSYRKRAQMVNIKPSSLLTILKIDLKLHPYKLHNCQELSVFDKAARVKMCLQFRDKISRDPEWINNVWFTASLVNF